MDIAAVLAGRLLLPPQWVCGMPGRPRSAHPADASRGKGRTAFDAILTLAGGCCALTSAGRGKVTSLPVVHRRSLADRTDELLNAAQGALVAGATPDESPPGQDSDGEGDRAGRGHRADSRAGTAREQLCGGQQRGTAEQTVGKPVGDVVGVVDFELDMNISLLQVLQQRPDRPWCVGEEALPAAQVADGLSANGAWVETLGGHLLQVRLEQLGEGNLCPESAAQTLQAD